MILKCKMCGGDLHPESGNTTFECESCGTVQTIPTDDGEKKTNLFNRANRLRMGAEFDKAASVYESIVAEFPEEAEAYWGLCLCAYGIEYVDDPATGEKKPTCHRTLPSSIMEDNNFELACDNADPIARRVYREEAKAIDRIQRDILSIVSSEKPYDVFICYKETAEDGGRTEDSVLAQDIYDTLTGKGLRVFFSRITLEDKLGQQYEPYIYAALSSAKVMLAVGTKFEYYDAVWVKNEWMRFLSMMKTDKQKTLIPCYKGIDAYDMPREFKNLQAQDMGKIGWLQDLTRGVMKLCGKDEKAERAQQIVREVARESRSNVDNLMERVKLFLEDGSFDKAEEYLEKVLNEDVRCAPAYVGLMMVTHKIKKEEDIPRIRKSIDEDANWKKALRFATMDYKAILDNYAKVINDNENADRIEENTLKKYMTAKKHIENGNIYMAIVAFKAIVNYRDSREQLKTCINRCREELVQQYSNDKNREVAKAFEKVSKAESDLKHAENELNRYRSQLSEREKLLKELSGEISRATESMKQIRGLFSGGKKKEAEEQIMRLKERLKCAEISVSESQNIIIQREAQIPNLQKAAKNAREELTMIEQREAEKARAEYTDDAVIAAAFENQYKQIGNIITFGIYPQTTSMNDKTAIEWLVLDYDAMNNRTLLLSRYGLDKKQYNTSDENATWETCTLRSWLNGEFLNMAFTAKEQSAIIVTEVDNSIDQGFDWRTVIKAKCQFMSGGNNTQDRVFLLSCAEAKKYLNVTYDNKNNRNSRVAPTAYAKKNNAHVNGNNRTADGNSAGSWLLRSPGPGPRKMTVVDTDGSLKWGFFEMDDGSCVRPAIWLNLETDVV